MAIMSGLLPTILLLAALPCATPAFDASTTDGRTLSGVPVELSAQRLVLSGGHGRTSVGTARLLTVVSQKDPRRPPQPFRVVVELIDGSTIVGEQYLAGDNQAQIGLAGQQRLKVPLGAVRSVQFEREAESLDGDWARLTGGKADSDLLVIHTQDALDSNRGVLHEVTESAVRFDVDGEMIAVKRARVYGFVYRHSAAAEPPPAVCAITDAAGSKWAAQKLSLSDKLQWTTCTGVDVSEPLEDIAEIDFSAGKVVYLSDLEPSSSAWAPFFAGEKPLPEAARFYAPRRDRGFESRTLLLGGKPYRKGMVLSCRTELTYRLPEASRRFDAVVGIDDAVRPDGRVRLVIRGDQRVLFDAAVSGTESPRDVQLDLAGIRRLTVVADFSGSLQAGSRLVLGNARVTK
jgi:hypothetical protein